MEQGAKAAPAKLRAHVAVAAERAELPLAVEQQLPREVRRTARVLAVLERDPGQRATGRVLLVQPGEALVGSDTWATPETIYPPRFVRLNFTVGF